jgi:hypothetical protein
MDRLQNSFKIEDNNLYGSSYYWNFRTSSFKQVACLILQWALSIFPIVIRQTVSFNFSNCFFPLMELCACMFSSGDSVELNSLEFFFFTLIKKMKEVWRCTCKLSQPLIIRRFASCWTSCWTYHHSGLLFVSFLCKNGIHHILFLVCHD